jgi:hypothetical protein
VRRLGPLLVAAAIAGACAHPAGTGGAARRGRDAPGASSTNATNRATADDRRDCAACHAEIVAEHQSSYHRAAFTDATFQASLALEAPEDRAFCVDCHAPQPDRAAGVGCASCHGPAPHDAKVAKRPASCAPCHEFTFDGRPELVQKTLSEHAASDFAAVACAECHMPARGGHKDHRFVAGHSPSTWRSAVHVDVARARRAGAEAAVRVTLRVDAGHAFPTGDMFRRARLMIFAEAADGHIVASAERAFGRTWTSLPGGARTQASDTRLRGAWSEELDLGEPTGPIARVRWSLVFDRVLAMRPRHVALASSDVVTEGELPW